MKEPYISTVLPAGYERYAIRMGGILLGVVDMPAGQGYGPVNMAHRWLTGESLPDAVKFWPVAVS